MERPKTPPRATQPAPVVSPPTPAVTRRIEENRLRAKAIRDQHEQARLASGAPGLDKTPSGFIATDNVHIPNSRKRTHADISSSSSSSKAHGPDTSLRPARNFTKFVDYDMSAMTDTRGGFLSLDDDPSNPALAPRPKPGQPAPPERPQGMTAGEWERLQTLRALQRTKAGPFEPSLSVLRDASVFGLCVCAPCKDRHAHRYSLLTKTECREDYLLTEGELRDADLLPHLNKPNPHKSHWHDMMLEEKLDAEFARREDEKRARKEKKFKEKLTDLKRKTRTEAFRRQAAKGAAGGPTKFGDAVSGGKHF
ncbi:DNA repair protein RAD14 [Verticillium dahliae]|nr:DNA repair protein RAD14 [Verticillium dahliae]